MTTIQVQRRANANVSEEYGCRFRRVLPWEHSGPADNGMGFATVPPGGSSEPHQHDEFEHFVIVHGRARIVVDDESTELLEGDVVRVGPGERHHFENVSGDRDLEYLCLWTTGEFA